MASEMLSRQKTLTRPEKLLFSQTNLGWNVKRANGNLGWNEVKRFENISGKSLSLMPKARYLYGDILICCQWVNHPNGLHLFFGGGGDPENWKPTPGVRTLKSTQLPSDYNKLLK